MRKLRNDGLVERAWTYRDIVFVPVSGRDRPLCVRSEADLHVPLEGNGGPKVQHAQGKPLHLPNRRNSSPHLMNSKQHMVGLTADEVGTMEPSAFLSNDEEDGAANTAVPRESTPRSFQSYSSCSMLFTICEKHEAPKPNES